MATTYSHTPTQTVSEYNALLKKALAPQPSYRSKLAEKQRKLEEKLIAKKAKLGMEVFDDGDSSENIRIGNVDTPETYHETDLHNERTKMLKQYAYLHPEMSPQDAYREAAQQAIANKVAIDAGQDLPQMIADYRKSGAIDEDYAPTAFDIYHAGDEASRFAERDNKINPTTGRDSAGNYLVPETGYFGRFLTSEDYNKEYPKRVVDAGYAAPGSTDRTTYMDQLKSVDTAREQGLGNYSSVAGQKVMDAIIETSYANRKFLNKGPKDTGEKLHYELPEDFQYQVGVKISENQLIRDPKTGDFYEETTDSNGNVTSTLVPRNEVSSVYSGSNEQGTNRKFGVARVDLKQEMWDEYGNEAPMVARYMDKRDYNPYLSEYRARKGEINPKTGGPALGYDGTPGPEGINPLDPNGAVIYMRTNAAEDIEKYVHTHAGQVEARSAGSDKLLSKKEYDKYDARFKAGTSEYTGLDAPLWDDSYDMNRVDNITDALKAEPMPSKSKQWNKIFELQKAYPDRDITSEMVNGKASTYEERLAALNEAIASDDDRSILAQAANFVSGVGQGAIKTGIVDTVDFVGEATGTFDLGDGDKKEELTKVLTHFDDKYSKKYLEANSKILQKNYHDIPEEDKGIFDEFVEYISGKDGTLNGINKIISNVDGKDFVDLMGNAFANTDTTSYSIGMMIGLVAGTKGAGLAKIGITAEKSAQLGIKAGTTTKEAIEIVKASKVLEEATKVEAIAVLTQEAYTNANMLQKAVNLTGKNAGLLTVNAGQVNDQLDEFEKNTGRPATFEEKITKYFTNLGGLYIDRVLDIGVLKGAVGKPGKELINGISAILKGGSKGAVRTTMETMLKSGMVIVAGSAVEFPTEMAQTAIEEFNKVDYSTEKGRKQFEGKVVDIVNAGVAGAGGGGHMSIPSAAVTLAEPVISKVTKQVEKTAAELESDARINKTGKFAVEDVTDLEEQLMVAAESLGNLEEGSVEYTEAEKNIGDLHNRMELAKNGETIASRIYDEEHKDDDSRIVTVSRTADEASDNIGKPIEGETWTDRDVEALTKDLAALNIKIDEDDNIEKDPDVEWYRTAFKNIAAKKTSMDADTSGLVSDADRESLDNTLNKTLYRLFANEEAAVDSRLAELPENATATDKVTYLLGSKLSETESEYAKLKADGSLDSLSPQQRASVEAKVELARVYKTADEVSREKLDIGSGKGASYQPGVAVWMKILQTGEGATKDIAIAGIRKFVKSQETKLAAYEAAGKVYDAEMDKLVSLPDSDPTKLSRIANLEKSEDIKVKGRDNYYNGKTKIGVVKRIKEEQAMMTALDTMLGTAIAVDEGTSPTVETETKVKPAVSSFADRSEVEVDALRSNGTIMSAVDSLSGADIKSLFNAIKSLARKGEDVSSSGNVNTINRLVAKSKSTPVSSAKEDTKVKRLAELYDALGEFTGDTKIPTLMKKAVDTKDPQKLKNTINAIKKALAKREHSKSEANAISKMLVSIENLASAMEGSSTKAKPFISELVPNSVLEYLDKGTKPESNKVNILVSNLRKAINSYTELKEGRVGKTKELKNSIAITVGEKNIRKLANQLEKSLNVEQPKKSDGKTSNASSKKTKPKDVPTKAPKEQKGTNTSTKKEDVQEPTEMDVNDVYYDDMFADSMAAEEDLEHETIYEDAMEPVTTEQRKRPSAEQNMNTLRANISREFESLKELLGDVDNDIITELNEALDC